MKKLIDWFLAHKEIFILLGLLILFFNINLFRQVYGVDYILGGYPVEKAIKGQDARWIPYIFCGVPAWIPPNPIFHLVSFYPPVELSHTRYYFVLFLLAGWGMFTWAKRWFAKDVALLGAVGWMLAPIMVSLIYAGHGGKIAIMAHFPWILWAIDGLVDRKSLFRFLALSVVILSAIFSWHSQMLAYALFFALVYGIWRAWGKWSIMGLALLSVVLGVVPSIPHYLAFKKIVSYSSRASGVGPSHHYNLPPSEIVGMINPSRRNPDDYSGPRKIMLHSEYIGIFIFLLGVLGLVRGGELRWVFLGVGLASLFFALGAFNWKMIRSPSMALFGFSFAWVVWAMMGAKRYLRGNLILLSTLLVVIDLAAMDYNYIHTNINIPQYASIPIEYRAYDAIGGGNLAAKGGAQIVNGNYPLIPKTFIEFAGGEGILPDFSNLDRHENYRKLANVKYLFVANEGKPFLGIIDALPKAFVVGKYRVIPGNCVDSIPLIDPANEVILADDPKIEKMGKKFTATITEYKCNEVVVAVNGDGPGILVMCDNYYPDWRCWVNGIETKIIRANHTFRAVVVPDKCVVVFKI